MSVYRAQLGPARGAVPSFSPQAVAYQREIVSPVSGSRNLQLVSDYGMGVAYCPLWRIPTREILSSALSRRHARTRARYRTPPHACPRPAPPVFPSLHLSPFFSSLLFFPLFPFLPSSPFSYRHRVPPFRRSAVGTRIASRGITDSGEISRRNRNRQGIDPESCSIR